MSGARPLETAEEQVKIKVRIAQCRQDFYRKHQRMPTTLYIGFQDFYNLCRESEPYELALTGRDFQMFQGLRIIRVERERHINVVAEVWLDD